MKRTHTSAIDILFTLALFCVFSATALGITLIGSKVYKNSSQAMESHFNSATAFSYIKEKVRQYDQNGGVAIEEVEGHRVLVLNNKTEQGEFKTMIYLKDQSLMELFVPANSEVGLSAGQTIVSAKQFDIEPVRTGLYKLSIIGTDSIKRDLYLTVQSSGGNDYEK